MKQRRNMGDDTKMKGSNKKTSESLRIEYLKLLDRQIE